MHPMSVGVSVTTHNLISQATFMTNPDSVKESIKQFIRLQKTDAPLEENIGQTTVRFPSIGRFIPKKFG